MVTVILERGIPFLITAVAVWLSYKLGLDLSKIKDYKFLYSNIISFSSIIIGFLITMVSILITLTGKKVMRKIKEAKAENLLKSYFIYPILSGLILTLFSIILGVVFDEKTSTINTKLLTNLWIFFAVYFIMTTFRIFIIMLKLLKAIQVENNAPVTGREELKVEDLNFSKEEN